MSDRVPLSCDDCSKKPFCSVLCPEAELFVKEAEEPRREFFTFSEAKYARTLSEPDDAFPGFSKAQWKILTLISKNCSRLEICRILGISRAALRVHIARIRRKLNHER